MSNKKVYLAKNTLASGFDVEYVRSHLSRIPGIVIVESGSSIGPGDCAAFVIVPDEHLNLDELDGKVTLSKNVHDDLEEFIGHFIGDPEEFIFIVSEHRDTDESGDVEESFPMALYLDSSFELDTKKKGHYDKFASLTTVDDDQLELLLTVTEIIDAPYRGWVEVKRHYSPKPEYAMPSIPSLEERQLKTISASNSFEVKTLSFDKRLLLLKRK